MGATYSWKILGIKRKTKRRDLLSAIERSLGEKKFSLSFKDNKPTGILITSEEEIPSIDLKGKKLSLKKKSPEVKEIVDIVTPMHHLTYEEQLEKKTAVVVEVSTVLECTDVESISSPVRKGYRNKCEFTFGVDETGVPTLGFRPAKYTDAPNLVSNPRKCIYNVGEEMLSLVEKINSYIKDKPFLVYDRIKEVGVLRLLMVRKLQEETICILQVYSLSLEEAVTNKDILLFCDTLNVDSVYLSSESTIHERLGIDTPLKLLRGKDTHREIIGGCTFSLSPLSFFQVNIEAAEEMIKTVKKHISTEVILDICCGSGLLGICTGKDSSKKVIGIEIDEKAVVNARNNAQNNGVTAEYHCGSIEKNHHLITKTVEQECTALLDPPRQGFSNGLIEKIVSLPLLKQIIYISCNYKAVVENLKQIRKSNFILRKTYVLDMFPYTEQVECIFIFEKI